MKSFISKIREKLGHDKFVHPAGRILIENEKGEFLFIHRADNGLLGIPAGGLEENETIEECIKREVYEETGIKLKNLTTIGISSNPKTQTVNYLSGDVNQLFSSIIIYHRFKPNNFIQLYDWDISSFI